METHHVNHHTKSDLFKGHCAMAGQAIQMVDCDEYLVVVTGEFRSGPRWENFPTLGGSGWIQKFRKVRAQMSQKNGNALEEILYIYDYLSWKEAQTELKTWAKYLWECLDLEGFMNILKK